MQASRFLWSLDCKIMFKLGSHQDLYLKALKFFAKRMDILALNGLFLPLKCQFIFFPFHLNKVIRPWRERIAIICLA